MLGDLDTSIKRKRTREYIGIPPSEILQAKKAKTDKLPIAKSKKAQGKMRATSGDLD
jgi:hypothetical protein